MMKAKEVPPGYAFKYAEDDGLGQTQFIKLNGKMNVVNVATWCAARVDEDTEVVLIGRIGVVEDKSKNWAADGRQE